MQEFCVTQFAVANESVPHICSVQQFADYVTAKLQ